MKKNIYEFLLALLGGCAIFVGAAVFLSVENKVAGALLFTVGLYTICAQGLNLYTGKVGYLVNNDRSYLPFLGIVWLGNLAGTWLSAFLVSFTRINSFAEKAQTMCAVKMQDSFVSLFLLAIFCGLLMYVAVDSYKKTSNPIILFVCVAGFILCGFEHCIADMAYISIAGMWSPDALLRIIVITLGNSLGGVLIPLALKMKPE